MTTFRKAAEATVHILGLFGGHNFTTPAVHTIELYPEMGLLV